MVEVAIVFEIEQVVGIKTLVITVGIGACVLDIDPRQPRLLVTFLDVQQPKRRPTVAQLRAKEILETEEYKQMLAGSHRRHALAFQLALRDEMKHNKNVHLQMYKLIATCDMATLGSVITIIAYTEAPFERYERVMQATSVGLFAPVTSEWKELIASKYK